MPEVAEIALTAQILSKYFRKKILNSVEFISGKYGPKRKKPDGYKKFISNLPLKVVKIDSKGKFMWFDLVSTENPDEHWYIWNNFGLTGMWSLYEPDNCRAKFTFVNGKTAYFSDQRNFGGFKFSNNQIDLEKKLNTLGPDFLKEENFNWFSLKKYNVPIVKLLMDQKKIGSGLGNYLSCEILYCAKISPHRTGISLSSKEIAKLDYWIKYVTKLSYVDNHIGYMINLEKEANKIRKKNYHPDIKLKEKTFKFKVYRQKTDPKGNPVKADKIIKGRTTYWVPKVQH